jgi:hypothetical protein
MKRAFTAALIATGLTFASVPLSVAAGTLNKSTMAKGSKADDCVAQTVTSAKFFNDHAGKPGPIDIRGLKRACEKKTGEKIRFFTTDKFEYDLD